MRILIIIVIIMMIVLIKIIVIALKGAIHDFYNLLIAPRTVSNMYTQVAWAQLLHKSHATHRVLIMCHMLCATWYKKAAQLLSLTEFRSHY